MVVSYVFRPDPMTTPDPLDALICAAGVLAHVTMHGAMDAPPMGSLPLNISPVGAAVDSGSMVAHITALNTSPASLPRSAGALSETAPGAIPSTLTVGLGVLCGVSQPLISDVAVAVEGSRTPLGTMRALAIVTGAQLPVHTRDELFTCTSSSTLSAAGSAPSLFTVQTVPASASTLSAHLAPSHSPWSAASGLKVSGQPRVLPPDLLSAARDAVVAAAHTAHFSGQIAPPIH